MLTFFKLQTVYSHSVEETEAAMKQALNHCSTSLNLNKEAMLEAYNAVVMSEDDADVKKMFLCCAKEMGMVDSNDDFVFDVIESVAEVRTLKLTSGAPNGAQKAHDLAIAAVQHCKDTPKQSEPALTAIKMRNCIRSYIATPQLLD